MEFKEDLIEITQDEEEDFDSDGDGDEDDDSDSEDGGDFEESN